MKSKLSIFLIFLTVFFYNNTKAQLSKKHFIPPLTYAEEGNANPENQYFYISTPSNKDVSYTITQIGSPGTDITGIVSSSSPQEIFIANGDSQLFVDSRQTSVVHNNKGYIVEATDVIYVSIRVLAGNSAQAGALVSKGSSALGTTFRAGMYTNESPQTNYLNFISVMASEDNTTVTFDDLPAGISIKNYSGTLPFSVVLNEGESYIVATNAAENVTNRDALIGTLINSDKPIVVNTGSANGSFHNGGGRDYGIDQIAGLDKVGTNYIFVKGDGNDGWENVLIVAHEDDTEIIINDEGIVTSINKGEFHLIEGDKYNSDGNLYVETSKPAFAYQGIGASTSEANQGMFFVPPLSCESRGKVDNIPNIESIGNVTFSGGVTIVTNANATVNINSQPITNFTTSGPFGIDTDNDGTIDYETYRVTNLTGNISVESSEELYCAYFNVNGAATSGSFYSGFPTAPEINFDTTVNSLGNCIPNITLEAANTDLFDSIKWEYFNETSSTWEQRSTEDTYKPIDSEPGRYRLIGRIECTNTTFESAEIPVSICPDDFDGDLIIDNLDVDIDNDGILNCDESLGNVTINLSDTNNAIALNPTTNTNVINFNNFTPSEATNTISGDNNGNFTSVVNPVVDSKLQYELKFTQNINFKFTQNKATDHVISEGEFFILKIGPSNKNVTLLDPDDQLLVDSNFDGEFETGVTSISASEIHFKYKANTTGGSSTFEFLANQVDQFDFKHQSTGLTTASTFNGNIEFTCFSLDSDGDGIENMFDLDSDNDGIPDVNEAFPQPSSLSGTDANQDGLDDMFNTLLNVDSDNDGILNYLDLDSDNDGIFDATEAGHNLDTDFDGVVDNANALVGINGLVDNLESVADAKALSLNYNVANTDNDTDFDFVELDADDDGCNDVTEAGFTDANNDGILDATPFAVDINGKVINNSDGYTNPNTDYTTSAPILLNTPFENVTFCENDSDVITIDSTADSFQWEISADGSTWNTISNNAIYSGSTSTSLQITNTPLSYNNNQYRVILNRNGNACTETSNTITLTVNPQPVLKPNPQLNQCIEVTDTNTTVNLTLAQLNISETPNVTFEYYEDMAGTNQITDPTSYPVVVNIPKIIYVKVISEFTCASELSTLTINVGQTIRNDFDEVQPPVCDDFLDADGNDTAANSDTDNITNFTLNRIAIVNSINPPINTEVFFYENENDRDNSLNEIDITNFRNDITKNDVTNVVNGIQFPIYYKILSTINNDCQGLGQFYLQINSVPVASNQNLPPISECDTGAVDGNFSNGSNSNIDLTQRIEDAINGTGQNRNDFIFTFYKSETAALSGDITSSDYINNPDQFTNDVPTSFSTGDIVTQSIFMRIENIATGCANPHTRFDVIINPVPIITNIIPPLEVCDMGTKDGDLKNGLAQNIDVSVRDSDILGTKNAADYTITYHKTQADLENLTSTGIDKNNYDSDPTRVSINPTTNSSEEVLLIRIINNDTQCLFNQSSLTIVVNPEPNIPAAINNYSVCDNASDTFGSDENGINGDITFNNKIPEILVNYTPAEYSNFNVTFYESSTEASTGDVSVALDPNRYQNTANDQTIYVRVENIATTCVYDDLSFIINIKPKPSFIVMGEENIDTPLTLCLNEGSLTIQTENAAADYSYIWTNESGAEIGYDFEQNVTSAGKYTVTAYDKFPEGCERKRTVVVVESNIANLERSFIDIVDEGNIINSENNLSISIDIINNDIGPGDYQFAIVNTTENNERTPMIGFQDEPLFENLEGGIYQIIVNDKNGCSPDTTLLVSVIQFPKFFTPNGDGKNDTYVIKGVNKDFYSDASINIFNRYGKLVAQEQIDSQGWNGIYNGRLLPSDDYWFNITLIPTDNTKPTINKKGNFSLLRK